MQVGRTREGAGVRRILLAHRAFHLCDRGVFALGEPIGHALQNIAERLRAAFEQGTGHVHDVGAGKQHFEGIGCRVYAAGGGQGQLRAAAQDGDPAHGEQGIGRGRSG